MQRGGSLTEFASKSYVPAGVSLLTAQHAPLAGTGKTVTLVECALQLLQAYPHARLLLCAPLVRCGAYRAGLRRQCLLQCLLLVQVDQGDCCCVPQRSSAALSLLQNYSADLLCSALAAAGLGTKDMLRLNDPRRPPFTVRACLASPAQACVTTCLSMHVCVNVPGTFMGRVAAVPGVPYVC